MHTIQLLLKTTEYDCQIIEKRFHAVSHVHNVLVKHAKKCLKRLNNDKEYLSKRAQYRTLLKKETLSKDERLLKKQPVYGKALKKFSLAMVEISILKSSEILILLEEKQTLMELSFTKILGL